MSWDIYLTEKFNGCPHCGRAEQEVEWYDRNYTSNMWPMLKKAGFSWDDIEGKPASEAYPIVFNLVSAMASDPAEYIKLNPPNGWGDYHSFMDMLREFRDKLIEHPAAIVHISR